MDNFDPKLEVIGSTEWLRLERMHFVDRHGRTRNWDRCVRPASADKETPDAALVLAKTVDPADGVVKLILVRQFRAPVGAYTLEFPAGLVDEGESSEVCAQRELREETGYVGKCEFVSPRLCLSPGMTRETCEVVTVKIESLGEACPDEGEDIEIVLLPLKNLRQHLDFYIRESEKKIICFDAVYTFALGLEMQV